MPDNATVIKNAVEAFNQGKTDAMNKLFGSDIASAAADSAKSMRGAFPDLQYTIDHVEAQGEQVTFTYSVAGTHKGALGDFKATNKPAKWNGWGVATVRDGVIHSLQTFDDRARAALQLGFGNPTMIGTWVGSGQGTTVTLVLTQSGTSVSGTATLSGSTESFPVSGTNEFPSVSLTGTAFGLPIDFQGTFNGPNSVPGTFTIQGFPPIQVTLNRNA